MGLKAVAFILTKRRQEPYAHHPARSFLRYSEPDP